jgi:hypothetical protein
MDFEQSLIIRSLFKEGVDANDIHTKLLGQFGDEVYSLRSVHCCCQYVRQGCELMHDGFRSGRPPVDFLDIQILSNLEKCPFHSAYFLAKIPKVAHATILKHLRDGVGMKHCHFRWIPHQLTEQIESQKDKEMLGLTTVARKNGGEQLP